jgi:hypothetical protein
VFYFGWPISQWWARKQGEIQTKTGLRKAGKVFSQEVRKKDQIVLLYPELDAH